MYKQRLYILIFLCILAIAVCLGRLGHLQLVCGPEYRRQIKEMRILAPTQLPTVRGKILDRNGKILATDKPVFHLAINYLLTKLLDERFWQGSILRRINTDTDRQQAEIELHEELDEKAVMLDDVIGKCAQISGLIRTDVENEIRNINDRIWELRRFIAWRRKHPSAKFAEYGANKQAVPISEILRIDLAEMHKNYPLLELKSDADLLRAQFELADIENVEILPVAKRVYPYDSAACQLIGWVGPVQEKEKKLFADDDYLRYLEGEVTGKDGTEKICEVILRGRRGEVTYDKDENLVSEKPTQFGKDVTLSLDIELQQRIESHLADPNFNTNWNAAMGAVVIDVATGDILSLVSMPVYNLNTVRGNYNTILYGQGAPMMNKSLAEHYPPGSVIKPFILIAALQEQKVAPREVISCPYAPAPKGWPDCMQFSRFGSCHDWKWENQGGNIARNAIRGSCNVYFSRLADRIDSRALQGWLYKFGYGRPILPGPLLADNPEAPKRNLRQSAGQISTKIPRNIATGFDDITRLIVPEKRMYGIGQAGLRVTVLQVANAVAAIARGGIYKNPRLFINESDLSVNREQSMGISEKTLEVVFDGMDSVVNETGGTGNSAFGNSDMKERQIKVYGKTGSSENPNNAWFACFATDSAGRRIALAMVVEGATAGGHDAAPLVRDIIQFCNEAGYIGKR